MILSAGTRVQGRYRIVHLIGQGTMGAVYKAVDEHLSQTVALKQTASRGEPFKRAFEREARILAGLRHPVLPIVTDYFVEEHAQYMVMDFYPGQDLAALLKQRGEPFRVEHVLQWADQVLHALEYMHRQNPPIIHRDIKPQNLKLTPEGQIVLLDFGLAKGNPILAPHDYERPMVRDKLSLVAQGTEEEQSEDESDVLFGFTRQYAALEQIQGIGADPRSDVYTLAATFYHLLAGSPPDDAIKRLQAYEYDTYSHYEAGLRRLINAVDEHQKEYQAIQEASHTLYDNIEQCRLFGDNPTSQEQRADVLDQVDAIAQEVVGQSFYSLCLLEFPPSDAFSTSAEGRKDPLIPVHERNPRVPVAVSAVLHQALSLDPDQRPARAHIMRARLQAAQRITNQEAKQSGVEAQANGKEQAASEESGEMQEEGQSSEAFLHDLFLPPHPQEPSVAPKRQRRLYGTTLLLVILIVVILLTQVALMVMIRLQG